MVYKFELDFWIDAQEEDNTPETVAEIITELLEGTAYGVEDIRVVGVNP
jgi:hypothetical protein